jgi:hypothetical protein
LDIDYWLLFACLPAGRVIGAWLLVIANEIIDSD